MIKNILLASQRHIWCPSVNNCCCCRCKLSNKALWRLIFLRFQEEVCLEVLGSFLDFPAFPFFLLHVTCYMSWMTASARRQWFDDSHLMWCCWHGLLSCFQSSHTYNVKSFCAQKKPYHSCWLSIFILIPKPEGNGAFDLCCMSGVFVKDNLKWHRLAILLKQGVCIDTDLWVTGVWRGLHFSDCNEQVYFSLLRLIVHDCFICGILSMYMQIHICLWGCFCLIFFFLFQLILHHRIYSGLEMCC